MKLTLKKAPKDGNSLRTVETRTNAWRVQDETKTKTKALKLSLESIETKTWISRTTLHHCNYVNLLKRNQRPQQTVWQKVQIKFQKPRTRENVTKLFK